MWSSSTRAPEGAGRRGLALVAGALALLVAAGPLDAGAAGTLTAHMVQHLLLLAVAPPLLVLGVGGRVCGRAWNVWAAGALAVHSVVMIFWHLPGPFGFALDHAVVHLVEHASLLGAGLAFWWVMLGAGRRAKYGTAVVAVFMASLPAIGVGAALVLAHHPWWVQYTLADQQLAGVLMWAVGGLIDLVAAVALFRSWMTGMEPAR